MHIDDSTCHWNSNNNNNLNDYNNHNKNNICSINKFIEEGNDDNLLSNIVVNTAADDNFARLFQPLYSFLTTFGDNILKAVITLFVVIDPIGIIPLFASLTKKMQKNEIKKVSQTATITSGVLLFVFAIAGTQIFALFGIDIFSFMIAGGMLFLLYQ